MCKWQMSALLRTIGLFRQFSCDAIRGTKTVLAGLAILASVLVWGSAPVRADDNDGDLGRHKVRVLTQNMFIGADIGALGGAKTPQEFLAATTTLYQNILATKPDERAAEMAAEIAKQRPDFVALHEAWMLTAQGSVKMDLLKSVVDDLKARGEPYDLVGTVTGTDVALPTSLGFNIHVTDRDAILMRTDVGIQTIDVQSPLFPTPTITPLPLPPPNNQITAQHGFVRVDAIVRGRLLRFVSVHLVPNPTSILPQTRELLLMNTTLLPLVMGGDFNTTADDPSDRSYVIYQTLINAGFTDAWNPQRPGPTCCQDPSLLKPSNLDLAPCPPATCPHRIDLILLRGGFAVENINLIGDKPSDRTPSGLWPSDHAGVVATVAGPQSQ
jgi:endonuclease/exonuclease/phosphatase family metal-dependent hydrolase